MAGPIEVKRIRYDERKADQIVEILWEEIFVKHSLGYTRTLGTSPAPTVVIEISTLPRNHEELKAYFKRRILDVLERPVL